MKRIRPCTLTLVSLAVALACDRSPTMPPQPAAPSAPLGGLVSAGQVSLLSCADLPYDSATQVIGPAGGSITVGPHTLLIPAGAVYKTTVSITAVAPTGTGANVLHFEPQGFKFKTPVYLTMSYANCQQAPLSKLIAYTVGGKVVEKEPSGDDPLTQTVTAQVTHFSNYAVAW